MPADPKLHRRLSSVLTDPVVALLVALAAISLVSRVWLLVAHRFR